MAGEEEKSIEMRLKEIEDKLNALLVTKEDIGSYQKVISQMGGMPMAQQGFVGPTVRQCNQYIMVPVAPFACGFYGPGWVGPTVHQCNFSCLTGPTVRQCNMPPPGGACQACGACSPGGDPGTAGGFGSLGG